MVGRGGGRTSGFPTLKAAKRCGGVLVAGEGKEGEGGKLASKFGYVSVKWKGKRRGSFMILIWEANFQREVFSLTSEKQEIT